MLLPQLCDGGAVEIYTIQRRRQKNIHNEVIQTKIQLYINKYNIKNITYVQNIVRQISVCVCVCVSVLLSRCMQVD